MNWIKTDKQLPEKNKRVLMYIELYNHPLIIVGIYEGNSWKSRGETFENVEDVKYWQPLPNKP